MTIFDLSYTLQMQMIDAEMKNLIAGLRSGLSALGEDTDPLERLQHTLTEIDQALEIFRQLAGKYRDNPAQTVVLLKAVRPEIEACRIEEGLRYTLLMNKPIGTARTQIRYYEDELQTLQGFLRLHAFYYQYYKGGFRELDELYFIPGAYRLTIPLPDIPATESDSTPVSYLFAKFKAIERMQFFIAEEIDRLQHPKVQETVPGTPKVTLKWTGDAINIVELAYGLWLTGQLNHGNASLNEIVKWLEVQLQVNIGVVQRRFIEIERRKRLSQTKYIDQMRDQILRKINGDQF